MKWLLTFLLLVLPLAVEAQSLDNARHLGLKEPSPRILTFRISASVRNDIYGWMDCTNASHPIFMKINQSTNNFFSKQKENYFVINQNLAGDILRDASITNSPSDYLEIVVEPANRIRLFKK